METIIMDSGGIIEILFFIGIIAGVVIVIYFEILHIVIGTIGLIFLATIFFDIDNIDVFKYILGLIIIFNLFKIIQYFKNSTKLYKTPYFSKTLVGMYVKFCGVVKEHNKIKLDIINDKCEFYEYSHYIRREVKEKAPSRGYKTVYNLVTQRNSGKFILSNNEQNIIVDVGQKNIISDNKSSYYQIEKIRNNDNTLRYKYLQKGNIVTVYGKLIKKNKDYIITNTYNTQFPFIITLGNKLSFGSFFKEAILRRHLLISLSLILVIINHIFGFHIAVATLGGVAILWLLYRVLYILQKLSIVLFNWLLKFK